MGLIKLDILETTSTEVLVLFVWSFYVDVDVFLVPKSLHIVRKITWKSDSIFLYDDVATGNLEHYDHLNKN